MNPYEDLSTPDDAETPATYDPVAKAMHMASKRDMTNVSIKMAALRSLHGTHPANRAHADAELWHYGTRIIAGDY